MSNLYGGKYFGLIIIITLISNSIIAVGMYPQESDPGVIRQLASIFGTFKKYKEITIDEFILYNNKDKFYTLYRIKNGRTRYILALYKFKDELKRNGSYYIYGNTKLRILEKTNISNHLLNGQDKVIWWLLKRFKK